MSTNDDYELLNCPCCGGPPSVAGGISGTSWVGYVHCCKCPMRTEESSDFDALVEAWNRRPTTNRADDAPPQYVAVHGLAGLRFKTDNTAAGDGFVWVRPAFIAARVPASFVIPWPILKD